MKSGFYDKFLTILLVVLIIAIAGTAGYLIYKGYEKDKLNFDAGDFLSHVFDEELNKKVTEPTPTPTQTPATNVGTRGIATNNLKYKGYDVAGKLEMPSVGLQYPILALMTNANALEVSVCIQYISPGSGLNKPGNVVIIGHNYRSGLFFGSNKKMQIGDTIYITDWETGTRKAYKIYNKYTANEGDTKFYNRNTNGKCEVSLVTCQNNNAYRLVILAREE